MSNSSHILWNTTRASTCKETPNPGSQSPPPWARSTSRFLPLKTVFSGPCHKVLANGGMLGVWKLKGQEGVNQLLTGSLWKNKWDFSAVEPVNVLTGFITSICCCWRLSSTSSRGVLLCPSPSWSLCTRFLLSSTCWSSDLLLSARPLYP